MSPAAAGGFNILESPPQSSVVELNEAVRKAEKRALEKALKSARGTRSVAARLLGVSRRTLTTSWKSISSSEPDDEP